MENINNIDNGELIDLYETILEFTKYLDNEIKTNQESGDSE